MSQRYVISNAAERDLRRIPEVERERIFAALDLLIADPPRGDVRKLQGQRGPRPEYRLRVGNWRVRFWYDVVERSTPPDGVLDVERTAVVIRVLDRKDAYRD